MMILGAHGVRQAEEIAGAGSKTLSRRRDVELLSSGTERLGLTKALVVSEQSGWPGCRRVMSAMGSN